MGLKKLFILSMLTTALPAVSYSADLTKGKQLFEQRCASCHGNLGAGDGPVAAALPEGQKPRDLSNGTMKYATDDTKLKELLTKGGGSFGLSPMMAPQVFQGTELEDLVIYVKSLKK